MLDPVYASITAPINSKTPDYYPSSPVEEFSPPSPQGYPGARLPTSEYSILSPPSPMYEPSSPKSPAYIPQSPQSPKSPELAPKSPLEENKVEEDNKDKKVSLELPNEPIKKPRKKRATSDVPKETKTKKKKDT